MKYISISRDGKEVEFDESELECDGVGQVDLMIKLEKNNIIGGTDTIDHIRVFKYGNIFAGVFGRKNNFAGDLIFFTKEGEPHYNLLHDE